MEEKIYFKPAKYGKGIKKQKEKTEKEDKDEKDHRVRNLTIFLIFIVAVVLIILWLLRGKTTTSGQYPANISNTSLECTNNNKHYEKIGSIQPINETIKLTLVFKGTEKLSTIGLRDRLEFSTKNEASGAEAVAHATLGTVLAQEGLKFTEFENKFTLLDNVLEISLHATASDINEYTASYFLINPNNALPQTLEEYSQNYSSQGFECVTNANK